MSGQLGGGFRLHLIDRDIDPVAVHNPLASNPLPLGVLGAAVECYAEREGDGSFTIRKK
jgi:hypothetical protein